MPRRPDTPDEAAFRAEVRAWLGARAELRDPSRPHRLETEEQHMARCRAWQRTRFEGGYAAITWPSRYGGRDGTAVQELIYREEESRFDVSTGFLYASIALLGPALLMHGTEEQRERVIPPMLRGDVVWCQLFSEPDAGSDLARLATRAERDGDELVVNGQKVWTTGAQFSDRGFLLARTDPDAKKHAGISFMLVDMHDPGVDVRPLPTASREHQFNEVFFTDVRVHIDDVVGGIGSGWTVARTTLANESVMIGTGGPQGEGVADIARMARDRDRLDDPLLLQDLAEAWIDERVVALFGERMTEATLAGRRPDLDGSVMKVFWSDTRHRRMELGARVLGAEALLDAEDAHAHGAWQQRLLSFPLGSIGGGTVEVHRNGIGERVLGLPREPRADRDMTFREVQAHDAKLTGARD